MPFSQDCQDRPEPTPPAPDTAAQLAELTSIGEQLGPDELAVLVLVAQRLVKRRAH